MKPLLVINASGRITRSITRRLTNRFVEQWRSARPGAEIIDRDVGIRPPKPVDESWIAAGYSPPDSRTPEMWQALEASETFIGEIIRAEAIVIGAPMYNFGMPAQLKAYVDQIVRVGRTFDFTPEEENPYRPLLPPKPVVVLVATGSAGFEPGGPLADMNFLEPHLQTILGFIGLTDVSFIRAGFEEFQDGRFERSMADAEEAVDETVKRLSRAEVTP